jgi:cell division protein FtsW
MSSAPERAATRRSPQPLEQSILLTATLCLLAAGAVMVYSASSARTLLQGHGDGTGYLIKYCLYAGLGLLVMRVLSRGGLDAARRLTGPLLAASFVLLLAVKVPHLGIKVNGAQRWLGAGFVQFQPSELMKLALVLYAAALLARRPRRGRSVRALARRACWSPSSPTSAPRWSSA